MPGCELLNAILQSLLRLMSPAALFDYLVQPEMVSALGYGPSCWSLMLIIRKNTSIQVCEWLSIIEVGFFCI